LTRGGQTVLSANGGDVRNRMTKYARETVLTSPRLKRREKGREEFKRKTFLIVAGEGHAVEIKKL